MRAFLCLLLLAAPAAAQELVFSPRASEACLAGAPDPAARLACAGRSAARCMADTPGGESTVGMGGCLSRELDLWDARLNAVYGQLMDEARRADADNAEYGGHAPSQAEALRDMQRAWIPFRDAKCAHARSLWGGGTGAGPAGVDCLMRTTAEQVIYLETSRMGG